MPGGPWTDIIREPDCLQLQADARAVPCSLVYGEKEAPIRDRRLFMVRILPYRTTQDIIDGVVITFIDITQARKMETHLSDALARNEPWP